MVRAARGVPDAEAGYTMKTNSLPGSSADKAAASNFARRFIIGFAIVEAALIASALLDTQIL